MPPAVCPRCIQLISNAKNDTSPPCQDCDVIATESNVRRAARLKLIDTADAAALVVIILLIIAWTSHSHASAFGDKIFLFVLMSAGFLPAMLMLWVNRQKLGTSRVLHWGGAFGASIGVIYSFWVPPRVAYSPLVGPLFFPLVIGLAGVAGSLFAGVVAKLVAKCLARRT